jgi:hypothetical protein
VSLVIIWPAFMCLQDNVEAAEGELQESESELSSRAMSM